MKQWSVLLPTRSGGKTRLNAPGDWSRACALDTLAAIQACPLVGSITVLGDLDYDGNVIADTGTGLNNEIERVARTLDRPLAIVLGDLPALTADALAEVLKQAATFDKCFVVDHAGTGTTMITLNVADFSAHFGEGSANKHLADGYKELETSTRVRLDVDTYQDLVRASEHGLGVETAKLFKSKSPDP